MANVMINGEPAAADVGEDLLTVARRQGAVIGFLCDGRGMCTTCQCQVLAGAGLLALTVLKLFFIDLSGTGAIGRIVSFLVVGLLMLLIGFFAPLPPSAKETRP